MDKTNYGWEVIDSVTKIIKAINSQFVIIIKWTSHWLWCLQWIHSVLLWILMLWAFLSLKEKKPALPNLKIKQISSKTQGIGPLTRNSCITFFSQLIARIFSEKSSEERTKYSSRWPSLWRLELQINVVVITKRCKKSIPLLIKF